VNLTRWLRYQWDRALAVGLALLGAVCLLLGYLGLSRHVYPAQQLPYILSGGLVGLFLLGIAGTLWLSADMQDEWRRLRDLEDAVRSGATIRVSPAAVPEAAVLDASPPAPAGSNRHLRSDERSSSS
jgi:hypothetical protein